MKEWFLNPRATLAPLEGVLERPPPGKVMVEDASLLPLARGLLERKLVRPLSEAELILVAGKPLLNDMFGMGKGKPADGDPQGREAQRLIMNLTATNLLCTDFDCDINALPFFAQWRSILVGNSEEVVWSYDDIKGVFCPSSSCRPNGHRSSSLTSPSQLRTLAWRPSGGAPASTWGQSPCPWATRTRWGSSSTHTGGRLQSMASGQLASPARGEIRKDRPVPAMVSNSALDSLWQVYCDDADYAQLVKLGC